MFRIAPVTMIALVALASASMACSAPAEGSDSGEESALTAEETFGDALVTVASTSSRQRSVTGADTLHLAVMNEAKRRNVDQAVVAYATGTLDGKPNQVVYALILDPSARGTVGLLRFDATQLIGTTSPGADFDAALADDMNRLLAATSATSTTGGLTTQSERGRHCGVVYAAAGLALVLFGTTALGGAMVAAVGAPFSGSAASAGAIAGAAAFGSGVVFTTIVGAKAAVTTAIVSVESLVAREPAAARAWRNIKDEAANVPACFGIGS